MQVEHQLVVHLQDHLRAQAAGRELARDVDHRDLDHVGGRALDRGVDGDALRGRARGAVARVDVAQEAAAALQSLYVLACVRERDRLVHVAADLRILSEVARDDLARFLAGDAQPLCQPE